MNRPFAAAVFCVFLFARQFLWAQCSTGITCNPTGAHSFKFGANAISGATYTWHFGDGDSATTSAAQHTYADTGTYEVCLSISSTQGNCDSCFTIAVSNCAAWFGYLADPTLTQPEEAIYFFYDSAVGAVANVSYLWSFGTGDYSTQKNPAFVYETDDAGLEEVCEIITDTAVGCRSTYCLTVDVPSLCGAAGFTSTLSGDTVVFTPWYCGTPVTVHWDFGDGNASTQTGIVLHNYTGADSFYVCLEADFDSVCQAGVPPCKAIFCGVVRPSVLAVDNAEGNSRFVTICPNPASNEVTIEVEPVLLPAVFSVYNLQGQMVYTGQLSSNKTSLKLNSFSDGIYIYNIKPGTGAQLTGKISKAGF